MKKVFIQSCHASLEHDQVVMFLSMGHQVAGNFDTGSKQRPKIEGVTDVSFDVRDAFKSVDMIVLHQVDNYSMVFKQYCDEMKGKPVVLSYFGQGCDEQHRHTASILSKVPMLMWCATPGRRSLCSGNWVCRRTSSG